MSMYTDLNGGKSFTDTKSLETDANSHIIGLQKNCNLQEKALTAGRGYIRHQAELDEHLGEQAALKDTEVRVCPLLFH